MIPTDFEGSNITLQPPAGMQNCEPIRACRQVATDIETGRQYVIFTTMWQPDKEELDRLKAGMPVQVSVYGATFAPMALGVAQPVHHT